MPSFSQDSLMRLSTCDVRLQEVFRRVVENFDISILCGHRNQEQQRKAFLSGASKLNWPNSKHNSYPSKAVDVTPYPLEWERRDRFYLLGGYVLSLADQMRVPLRWGGDWDQTHRIIEPDFEDLVHFELREE